MAFKIKKKNKEKFSKKSEFHDLYENEIGSDVALLVGTAECQERLPAHSWVLVRGSDYFMALFRGPLSDQNIREFHFPEDNITGFNNLIRWMYQSKCDLQSLQNSLDTLQVAIKYLCPELAVACVNQITKQLTVKNVLRVVQSIQCYCHRYEATASLYPHLPYPSAPSLESLEELPIGSRKCSSVDSTCEDPTVSCQQLYNECLDIIDKNADEVLSSGYLICASGSFLSIILQRPSLNVSSELEIFRALLRWSNAECKRRHLPLTLQNRRYVLGSLLGQARLLALSALDIENAKDDLICLLSKDELDFIELCINQNYCCTEERVLALCPAELQEHVEVMSTLRSSGIGNEPPKSLQEQKPKKKFNFKGKFSRKELVLDLVSILALLFD